MAEVKIRELAEHHRLEVRAGSSGLDRVITNPRIQKPGLALTGYSLQLDTGRLLTLGGTEIEYLASANPTQRDVATATVIKSDPACIVITRGLQPPTELVAACDQASVPLLVSNDISAVFIQQVKDYLQDQLSPATTVHGVLVEVHGLGILLLGESGIGKSEAAIDLVVRGHRLVADDIVRVRRTGVSTLVGRGPELLGHHMEIRGLGVINVEVLFGVTAVRDSTRIRLVLELVAWSGNHQDTDRLGADALFHSLLSEEIPLRRIPVTPGRNIATIIEVAARDQLLREMGRNSALELEARLTAELMADQAGASNREADE